MGGGSRPEKQCKNLLRKEGPSPGISQPTLAAEDHPGGQAHSYPMEQKSIQQQQAGLHHHGQKYFPFTLGLKVPSAIYLEGTYI